MSSTNVQIDNSNKSSKCQLCGVILTMSSVAGLISVAIYNFIITVIAVFSFTNRDLEDVCPNSELWWWALFIGIIWPFLLSNGTKNAAENDENNKPFLQVFLWICMLTTFIVWAWDQLWGVSGFANDTCAMDNFGTYNSTDGADNDGHKLFTAVEYWMYFYMVIDAIFILGFFGIGGSLVFHSFREEGGDRTKPNNSDSYYGGNNTV